MNKVIKNFSTNTIKRVAPLFGLPYEVQLPIKQLRVLNAVKFYNSLLRKCPEFSDCSICEIESIQKSPVIDGYKNQMKTFLEFNNKDVSLEKFNKTKKNYKTVFFSENCNKLNKSSQLLIIKLFESYLKEESRFNELLQTRDSTLNVMIRSNRKDESLIRIIFNGKNPSLDFVSVVKDELLEVFLPRLLKENINIRSLYWKLKSLQSNRQSDSHLIWGDEHIDENICGKLIRINDKSIFEVNTDAVDIKCQLMKRLIKESQDLDYGKKILILDLFCKIGTFGIVLSELVSKVIGVDNNLLCIEEAKCNASVNNLSNIEHVCDDVEHFITNFLLSGEDSFYDEIIAIIQIDKLGIGSKVCLKLRQIKCLRMIIVSTDSLEGEPTMNIFNLSKTSEFSEMGNPFKLTKVCPVDSLPQTKNVDVILKLIR